MLYNNTGEMAEKGVTMFLIILAAIGAFAMLGSRISGVVSDVGNAI